MEGGGGKCTYEKANILQEPLASIFQQVWIFALMTEEFFSNKLSFPFILTPQLSISFSAAEGKMLPRGSSAALNFSRMEQKVKVGFTR